jgi:MscS family membrane protein
MMIDTVQLIDNLSKWVPIWLQIIFILSLSSGVNYLIVRMVSRLQEKPNLDRRLIRQIGLLIRYLVFLIALVLIFNISGAKTEVLLTSLGIAGIAAGLAAQDLLSNVLNGVFLFFEKTISVSDVVKIGDVYGVVRLTKLRTTEIRTFDNNIVSIPNSEISKRNIINMTNGSRYCMTSIDLKLGYNADFDKVMEHAREIINRSEGVQIGSIHGIKFEISNMEQRFRGLILTIYFFVEALNEPWIRTAVHKNINSKLVEEKVPFHRDPPR